MFINGREIKIPVSAHTKKTVSFTSRINSSPLSNNVPVVFVPKIRWLLDGGFDHLPKGQCLGGGDDRVDHFAAVWIVTGQSKRGGIIKLYAAIDAGVTGKRQAIIE